MQTVLKNHAIMRGRSSSTISLQWKIKFFCYGFRFHSVRRLQLLYKTVSETCNFVFIVLTVTRYIFSKIFLILCSGFDFILQAMGMCCVRCCYQVPALIRGSASVRRTLFSPSFSQFSHFWVGSSEKQFSHRLNENIRLGSVQRAVTVREGNGLQAYKGMGNWIRLFARGEWKIFV